MGFLRVVKTPLVLKKVARSTVFLFLTLGFIYTLFNVNLAEAKIINLGTAGDKILINVNIGVGTTNPLSSLHFYGTSGTTTEFLKFTSADGGDIRFGKDSGVDNDAIIGTWTNNDLSFYTNSTSTMILKAGGNLGIGTSNPDAKLDVSNGALVNSTVAGNHYRNVQTTYLGVGAQTGTLKIVLPKQSNTMLDITIRGYDYSSIGSWEVRVSGYAYNNNGWYSLNNSAQIIGRAPFSQVRLAYDGSKPVILLGNTSTIWTHNTVEIADIATSYGSQSGWGLGWSTSLITAETGLTIQATPTIYTYINSVGNVGIGTTNPGSNLHVRGNLTGTGSAQIARFDGGTTVASGGLNFTSYYDAATPNSRLAGIQSMDRDGNAKDLLLNLIGGNVGIGTTTIGATLDIRGAVASLRANSATLANIGNGFIMADASGNLYSTSSIAAINAGWTVNGTTVYKTDVNGNVGIGTTLPGAKLAVNAAGTPVTSPALSLFAGGAFGSGYLASLGSYGSLSQSSSGTNFVSWGAYNSGSSWARSYAGSLGLMNLVLGTGPYFSVQTDTATSGVPNFVDRLTVGTNGNVGIGTTNPGALLDINGTATPSSSGQEVLRLRADNGLLVGGGAILNFAQTNGAVLGQIRNMVESSNNVALSFSTYNTGLNEKMRITASGNVGIGNTNPNYMMTIDRNLAGTPSSLMLRIANSGGTNTPEALFQIENETTHGFGLHGRSGVGNPDKIIQYWNLNTGDIGIGTTTIGATLDIRSAVASLRANSATLATIGNGFIMADASGNLYSTSSIAAITALNTALNALWSGNGNDVYKTNINGNVGIGTTGPAVSLDVSTDTGVIFRRKANSGQYISFLSDSGYNHINFSNIGAKITDITNYNSLTDVAGTPMILGAGNAITGTATPDLAGGSLTLKSGVGTGLGASTILFQTGTTGTTGLTAQTLSTKMTILGNGNVGIGTSNPLVKLNIVGGVGLPVTSGTAQTNGSLRLQSNNAVLDFGSAGSGGAWLQSTDSTGLGINYPILLNPNGGNVGIGTTNPLSTLHLDTVASTSTRLAYFRRAGLNAGIGSNYLEIGQTGYSGLFAGVNSNGAAPFLYGSYSEAFLVNTGTTGTNAYAGLSLGTNNIVRMRIDSAGSVGIGTTNPGATLDIGGALRANSATLATIGNGFIMADASGNLYSTSSIAAITALNTALNALWSGNGNDVYKTNINGNVGIGTTAPDANLSINGSTANLNTGDTFRVYRNVASYNVPGPAATGTVEIIMPKSWTNTMMTVKITGYNYSASGAYEIVVSGYNYSSSSWVNTSVSTKGRVPFGLIRLAYDNASAKNVILLGNVSTVLSYPKISVSEVLVGHSAYTGWGVGWSIAQITDESNIAYAVTPVIDEFINSTGNVGISTTNPVQKLEINGDGARLRLSTASSPSSYYFDIQSNYSAADTLNFYGAGGSNILKWIYSTNSLSLQPVVGNVGISTTNPGAKLDVLGSLRASSATVSNLMGGFIMADASGNLYSTSSIAAINAGWTVNGTTVYKTDINGNVGIGTIAPNTKLQISSGNSSFTPSTATFSIQKNEEGYGLFAGIYSDGTSWLQSGTKNDATNYNLALQSRGGNVGINTSGPAFSLDVNGIINAQIGYRYNGGLATAGWYLRGNGTNFVQAQIAAGDVPTLNQNTTGSAYYLNSRDTRAVVDAPQDFGPIIKYDFKGNAINGLSDGGTYNGVMTWRKYGSTTDFTGGPVFQLAYTDNGNLWTRTSTGTSTWATWKQMLDSSSGIKLQAATPGTQQAGHLNISGAGLFGGSVSGQSFTSALSLGGSGNHILFTDNGGTINRSSLLTNTNDTELGINGGIVYKRTAVADAAYAATSTDYIIAYTSLTVDRVLTLPTCNAAATGRAYIIVNETSGTNKVVVTPSGVGATISGNATFPLSATWSIPVYCNGNNSWFIY